jgi:hypothetical protein
MAGHTVDIAQSVHLNPYPEPHVSEGNFLLTCRNCKLPENVRVRSEHDAAVAVAREHVQETR